MKILYIRKQIDESFWKRWPKVWRDWFWFHHREGFFRASLHSQATVHERSYPTVKKMSKKSLRNYDAMVINELCNSRKTGTHFESLQMALENLKSKFSLLPTILLLPNDSAGNVPSDNIMDYFQLVIKREPYKNRGRYELTNQNRDKIKPTILSCPLVSANKLNYTSIDPTNHGTLEPREKFELDLFFSGKDTSDQRRELTKFLQQSKFEFEGGLQYVNEPIPDQLKFPRLSKKKFHEKIKSSAINFAIEGLGEFTYRHWELWGLSAFMISSPSLNKLEFPFTVKPGKHYVTFSDPTDLTDKITYYLNHPKERTTIAKNGRELFEREYQFSKYGSKIISWIN